MSLWVAAVICRQINMDMEIALFLGLFCQIEKEHIQALINSLMDTSRCQFSTKFIISVVFLLTSSVATVAICCLELKAVWISYR